MASLVETNPVKTGDISVHPLHLLFVNEDSGDCPGIVDQLEHLGHVVACVSDEQRAFDLLNARPFDLLLISTRLTDTSGEQVLRRVMADDRFNRLPVIMVSSVEEEEEIARYLRLGADDYVTYPTAPALLQSRIRVVLERQRLLNEEQARLERIQALADGLKTVVLPTSLALTAETDFNRLLEHILIEAKRTCHADAATLYLRDGDHLKFSIVLTDSLGVALGGTTGRPVTFPPLPLYDADTGEPNYHNVASYVALTGETVNIPDVYTAKDFDFSATKEFDQRNGYRTMSTLTVPVKNNLDEIVGIVQLLNALDPKTKAIIAFDIYHQLMIETLASQVAIALNNQLMMERQTKLAMLEYDVQVGRRIQTSFLPKKEELPKPEGWEIAARLYPARQVSGDFYDAFEMSHNKLGFLVADVADKGVGAALFMAVIRSLTRAFAQQHYPSSLMDAIDDGGLNRQSRARFKLSRRGIPSGGTIALGKAVTLTNDDIARHHGLLGMFATMFIGMLDPGSGEILYINAGHNPPVIIDANGSIKTLLDSTGPAVGMFPARIFEIERVQLEPGETLILFSDGVPEARATDGSFYTDERLLLALEGPVESAEVILDRLDADVRAFTSGADQFDDITMMAVRRCPPLG